MSLNFSEIFKLSLPERILLVEALWDSIANEGNKKNPYHLSEEQVRILEDEIASYAKDPDAGSSWEDVKKRIISGK